MAVRCGVCTHARRQEIETAAAAPGASALDVALAFELSKASLERHLAQHRRAPAPAASPPKPRRGRAGAPSLAKTTADTIPPPPPVAPAPASELEADPYEDGPATSRCVSGTVPTARAELDKILASIRELLEDVKRLPDDPDAPAPTFAEKAAVLRTALTSIRLLAHLTGELGASEAVIATSPHWKRLEADLLAVLKGHPAALKDVVDYLSRKQAA